MLKHAYETKYNILAHYLAPRLCTTSVEKGSWTYSKCTLAMQFRACAIDQVKFISDYEMVLQWTLYVCL